MFLKLFVFDLEHTFSTLALPNDRMGGAIIWGKSETSESKRGENVRASVDDGMSRCTLNFPSPSQGVLVWQLCGFGQKDQHTCQIAELRTFA